MTPERWQQVEDVLQAALDRAPAERAVFLSEACSGDEELARETTSLIEAYDQAGDFIEEPAIAQDAEIILSGRELNRIGKEIGPYQIIDQIAASGMAQVFLARDPRLDRLVALKLLSAHFDSDVDDDRLRRFQMEARAASALNHTNIVTIYDVGQVEDIVFLAAEYIEGLTIRELIAAGNLSLAEVLEIIDQILSGLTVAHTAGIVHRDIKPENVIRRNDDVVKILDFGVAKLLEESSSETSATGSAPQTESGLLVGTVGYMSPEQLRCSPVDGRTDLWCCGVVFYEMLSQRRPFEGTTTAEVIAAKLEREPAPLFGISETADPVLRQIQSVVNKALRKDPAERYQTAAEMRADLAQIKQELAVEKDSRLPKTISLQTSVSEFPEIAARTIPRKMRREILVLLAAAMLVALFAGLFLSQRYKSRSAVVPATTVAKKPYLQMSAAEQLAFVEAQEQRISAMMGERPVKLNDEALRAIKAHVDYNVTRYNKAGNESLRSLYARAPEHIPTIARAFAERKIPLVIGLYLPMIESAYTPCYENQFGAKGLFQFLPATAEHYGVARKEMCDVKKMAPAAAHYFADRMAELGDDSQSMTLVLLSYNQGTDPVTSALRRLREIDANYERSFWTLFANREKLGGTFPKESANYVPGFFAAAIIGENPEAFDLQMPPLSSFASDVRAGER